MTALQAENAKKLDEIRHTVDEEAVGGRAAKKRADPCPTRTILAKAKEWLDAGADFDQ